MLQDVNRYGLPKDMVGTLDYVAPEGMSDAWLIFGGDAYRSGWNPRPPLATTVAIECSLENPALSWG
eukprot:1139507-Pelagomonas_calceolata.AAC.2